MITSDETSQIQECPTLLDPMSLCMGMNATFKKFENLKSKCMQEKESNPSVQIENLVPENHCSASLGTALCKTVTRGTQFSICTTHSCKILKILS